MNSSVKINSPDYDALLTTFDMLNERLASIEFKQDKIIKCLQTEFRWKSGKISGGIYDLSFDFIRNSLPECNYFGDKTRCIYLEIGSCLLQTFHQSLYSGHYNDILCNKNIDHEKLIEMYKDSDESESCKEFTQKLNISSHYDFISDMIGNEILQTILVDDKTWKATLISGGEGFFLWYKNFHGTFIDEFMDVYQKILHKCGHKTIEDVNVYDVDDRYAHLFCLLEKYESDTMSQADRDKILRHFVDKKKYHFTPRKLKEHFNNHRIFGDMDDTIDKIFRDCQKFA